MKFIKKLIKPLTRVVVALLAALGAIGVFGTLNALRKPEYARSAAEQRTVDNWKNLVAT